MNSNLKSLILYVPLFVFCSCGHNIVISPKGCVTKSKMTIWNPEENDYHSSFKRYSPEEKQVDGTFIKVMTLHAPFSFFTKQKFNLKELLQDIGYSCEQVRELSYSLKNGPIDVLASIIQPLAQTTLIMEGKLHTLDSEFESHKNKNNQTDKNEDEEDSVLIKEEEKDMQNLQLDSAEESGTLMDDLDIDMQ